MQVQVISELTDLDIWILTHSPPWKSSGFQCICDSSWNTIIWCLHKCSMEFNSGLWLDNSSTIRDLTLHHSSVASVQRTSEALGEWLLGSWVGYCVSWLLIVGRALMVPIFFHFTITEATELPWMLIALGVVLLNDALPYFYHRSLQRVL